MTKGKADINDTQMKVKYNYGKVYFSYTSEQLAVATTLAGIYPLDIRLEGERGQIILCITLSRWFPRTTMCVMFVYLLVTSGSDGV